MLLKKSRFPIMFLIETLLLHYFSNNKNKKKAIVIVKLPFDEIKTQNAFTISDSKEFE